MRLDGDILQNNYISMTLTVISKNLSHLRLIKLHIFPISLTNDVFKADATEKSPALILWFMLQGFQVGDVGGCERWAMVSCLLHGRDCHIYEHDSVFPPSFV